MKTVLVVASLLVSTVAFADHHEEMKEGKFSERKAKVMAKIEKRITAMNNHKSCVSAAADKKALKACRGKMKGMRDDWKEKRMERKKNKKSK